MNELSVKKASADRDESMHVLYSRGKMLDGSNENCNYFECLQKIAKLTRRSSQEVEEIVLSGERKKISSSLSLKQLILLEAKFRELGLDVYIDSDKKKKLR